MSSELYRDRVSRLDTLGGLENLAYWHMLVRLSDEFTGEKDPMFGMPKKWAGFADWCEHHHGFRPTYDTGGGITGVPMVIDEKRYMLCVLKYGG